MLADARAYPREFGVALESALRQQKPVADLRGKVFLTPGRTDRELFENEPLGDLWWDAKMPWVFEYLYHNRKLNIPESWEATMETFRKELLAAPGLNL